MNANSTQPTRTRRPVLLLVFLLATVVASLGGCATLGRYLVSVPDEPLARSYLEKQGYVDITITGWAGPVCPDGGLMPLNHSSTAFTARTPNGRETNGMVCCARDDTCRVYEDQ